MADMTTMDGQTPMNVTSPETVAPAQNITPIFAALSGFILKTPAAFYALYILPLTLLLGLLGNGFTCVSIVSQKLWQKSTIFIFIGVISALDFVYLGFHSGPELLEAYWGVDIMDDLLCQIRLMLVNQLASASVWVLVACNAVKLYSMAYPLKAMQRDTKTTAVILCVVIVVFFSLAYVPMALTSKFRPVAVTYQPEGLVVLQECSFYQENPAVYQFAIIGIMSAYVIIPGVLLFGMSMAILVSFRRSYKRHKALTQSESVNTGQSKSDTFSAAQNAVLVLVPMSIIHIVVTLPVYLVLVLTVQNLETIPPDPIPAIIAFYVSTHSVNLNHSVNVYVQLSISKFYRQSLFGIDPKKSKKSVRQK